MRSRLEASAAASFDAHRIEWSYEPRCYADQHAQYLPDFELWRKCAYIPTIYLEMKGLADPSEQNVRSFLTRMEVIWSSEPDARLAFIGTGLGHAWQGVGGEWWQGMFPVEIADVGAFFCPGCEPCVEASEAREAAR
jgi:hypothetical protein